MPDRIRCPPWLFIQCRRIAAWDLRHSIVLSVEPVHLVILRAPSTTRRALRVQPTHFKMGLGVQYAYRALSCQPPLLHQGNVGVLLGRRACKVVHAWPAKRASLRRWMAMPMLAICAKRASTPLVQVQQHVLHARQTQHRMPEVLQSQTVNAHLVMKAPTGRMKDNQHQKSRGA